MKKSKRSKRTNRRRDPQQQILDRFDEMCEYIKTAMETQMSIPVPGFDLPETEPDPGPNWIPAPTMNPEEVGFPPPHPEDQPEPYPPPPPPKFTPEFSLCVEDLKSQIRMIITGKEMGLVETALDQMLEENAILRRRARPNRRRRANPEPLDY